MSTKQTILDTGTRFVPGFIRRRYGFFFRPVPDFIFIHIPKTAGTSMEAALNYPREHKTALEKQAEMGQFRWNRRFTFSVVRNPWDRLLSFHSHERTVSHTLLAQNPVPFGEWVRSILVEGGFSLYEEPKYSKYLSNQWDWIADEDGNILVDFVARFERLQTDFKTIAKAAGQPNATLPHVRRSDHDPDYRIYYDDETRALVESFYAEDIRQFGYVF